MNELILSLIFFLSMTGASIGMLLLYPKLPDRHRSDETNAVVRLVANLFVVTTSLVFGLLLNSSKNTFESVDANIHAYATSIIVFDRTLRDYGEDGQATREALSAYVDAAILHFERGDEVFRGQRSDVEVLLENVGSRLNATTPRDPFHEAMLLDLRQQYRSLVTQRWKIVEQSEGSIPSPVIFMLATWLALIFASFGYRAPRNRVVASVFVGAALLISVSVYLVQDMNMPFEGPVQVSDAPLRRAAAQLAL